MDEQSIQDAELSVLPDMIRVRRAVAVEDNHERGAFSRQVLSGLAALPPLPSASPGI